MYIYSLHTILTILIIHWLADFALQTQEQASLKSSDNKLLVYHVGAYSVVWFFATWALYQNYKYAFIFSSITFILHYITDYITSRVSKNFWEKQDTHNAFVIVGFDQILHYVQLLLTHSLIIKIN